MDGMSHEPATINTAPKNATRFTVTPIDMDSPEIARLTSGEAEVMSLETTVRPLNEVVRPSIGCISEDENRERMAASLDLDLPSIAALKGKYLGQKLIICGGGASLARTLPDVLEAISASKRAHAQPVKILAVNKTHDWLVDQGIVPDFGVMMDPRAHLLDYMTPHRRVKYLFGATVDARIFAKFAGHQTYLWYPVGTPRDQPFLRDLLQRKYPWKSVAMIPGPSTVGLRSVYLAMDLLGFEAIELHGFDSCYDWNTDALWPYKKEVSFERIRVEHTTVSKTDGAVFKCFSNPDMARQVYEFNTMIEGLIGSVLSGQRKRLPNITVAGDGAIPWMAWKNNGHATPRRMAEKYGDAKGFNYTTGQVFAMDQSPLSLGTAAE